MIIVDSPSALETARNLPHCRASGTVTDNPLLAKAEGLDCLEALLAADLTAEIGAQSLVLASRLNDVMSPILDPGDLGQRQPVPVERAVRVLVATLLHRAAVFAAGLTQYDPEGVTLAVHQAWGACDNHGLDPGRFAHPFPVLADAGFLGAIPHRTSIVEAPAEGAHNDTSSPSLLARLLVIPVDVLADIAKRRLFGAPKTRQNGPCVPILGDSELLREIGPELQKLGWNPRHFKGVAAASRPAEPLAIDTGKVFDEVGVVIRRFLAEQLPTVFSAGQKTAIEHVLAKRLAAGAPFLGAAIKAGAAYADSVHAKTGRPSVVLTSAMSHAACSAFHRRAQSLNMKVILCEHGIAKGLAGLSAATQSSSELSNCDTFLALTPRSASCVTGHKPKTEVVGSPAPVRKLGFARLQRYLTRRRLAVSGNDPVVFHVSALPFYSNQRPGFSVGSEADIFDLEAGLLENVYAKIGKRVLFKSYPTRRFPFHPTVASLFPEIQNVQEVGMEDFRYLRSAADVIVTGTATSTIAWCLGANVPVVWWHSGKISPVLPDILPAFEKSLLCFDADAPDFTDQLRLFLDQPLQAIKDAWALRATAREAFLAQSIFGPAGKAGRMAAEYVYSVAAAQFDEPPRRAEGS